MQELHQNHCSLSTQTGRERPYSIPATSLWRQTRQELDWVKHFTTEMHTTSTSQSQRSNRTKAVSCSLARKERKREKKNGAMLLFGKTYLHKMSHKTHAQEADSGLSEGSVSFSSTFQTMK